MYDENCDYRRWPPARGNIVCAAVHPRPEGATPIFLFTDAAARRRAATHILLGTRMDNETYIGTVRRILGNVVYAGIAANGSRNSDETEIACSVRGKLKLGGSENTTLVAVGDRVRVRLGEGGSGAVEEVLPRRTLLARKWVLSAERVDPVVANADALIIVVSVVPPVKPGIVDRYLVAASAGGLAPIIVLNKIDLAKAGHEREKLAVYRSLGYSVLESSSITGEGMEALGDSIAGRVAAFCGHSGVGKSSMLNRLFGLYLKTGDVAGKTMKGRHTTAHVQMYANPRGGWVIDTPGIRSFGVAGVHSENLIELFPEIASAAANCPFRDCSHSPRQEKSAVTAAIAGGGILKSRYDSYEKLKMELEDAEVY